MCIRDRYPQSLRLSFQFLCPATLKQVSLILNDAFPFGAHPLLVRHVGALEVRTVENRDWKDHFPGNWEISQMANSSHCTHTSLKETIAVSGREQLSGFHCIDRFLGSIHANDKGFSICRIQRFDGSKRHRVVRGEDAVDLCVRLQKVLGYLKRHIALKVARLRGQHFDVWKFFKGLLESSDAFLIVGRSALALDDDDVPL